MSIRDHRRNSEGKRFKRRMPKPEQIKMGTRIHSENTCPEPIPEVVRCSSCGHFEEIENLVQSDFSPSPICQTCLRSFEEEEEARAYKEGDLI